MSVLQGKHNDVFRTEVMDIVKDILNETVLDTNIVSSNEFSTTVEVIISNPLGMFKLSRFTIDHHNHK